MRSARMNIWPKLVLLFFAATLWPQSPARVEAAPECMTVKDVERINKGIISRVEHFKGKAAKVFVALDPIWSEPEFHYEEHRDHAWKKQSREALAKANIDELVLWKLTQQYALGAAVPFGDGCAVSGYGEPDWLEKLTLMAKTTRLISKHGLDDRRVRDSIEKLLEASDLGPDDRRYQGITNTTDEMVEIMIE